MKLRTATTAALLSLVAVASASAEPTKIRRIEGAYQQDTRLVAVTSQGPTTMRCVGANVGNFAILTSHRCLEAWWTKPRDFPVRFATDPKREFPVGRFERAHRAGTGDSWVLLETFGHSGGYFGTDDLERVQVESQTFEFVGFSTKVKGGRELAIQTQCPLWRTDPGHYQSECGRDFDSGAILILSKRSNQIYASGLATVVSQTKVGKKVIVKLDVLSRRNYGYKLDELRRDQETRYAAVVARRNEAARQAAIENADADAEAEARRERRSAQRQADLERLIAAAGQLGATLGARGKTPATPVPPTPSGSARPYQPVAPTYPSPAVAPTLPARPRPSSARWQPSSNVRLGTGQMVQVLAVTADGSRVGYINLTLAPFQRGEFGYKSQIDVFVGNTTDPALGCTLTIDGMLTLDGQTVGMFWGKDTFAMQTTKGVRNISVGTVPSSVVVNLNASPISCP